MRGSEPRLAPLRAGSAGAHSPMAHPPLVRDPWARRREERSGWGSDGPHSGGSAGHLPPALSSSLRSEKRVQGWGER